MLLSVVIPFYHVERYIGDCLALAAQLPQVKDADLWLEVIGEAFPEKLRALNIEMFKLGFAGRAN